MELLVWSTAYLVYRKPKDRLNSYYITAVS